MLPNGKYQTAGGSTVVISGEHGGVARVEFDWLEEHNACFDCVPQPYPEDCGEVPVRGRLVWACDQCGGGSAPLFPVPASV